MNFTLRVTDTADEAVRDVILDSLVTYNTAKTGISDYRPLVVALSDDAGGVIGGLWGWTAFDWLFTELLFVPESLRGRGVGRDILSRAEAEALARGCNSAWLDTFGFQARGFYERLGYECFGTLDNYPEGFSRYFMRKALSTEPLARLP
jgi:GNAT superfamily N-acetyltransferase